MHDPLDLVYVPRCQRIEHAVVPDPQPKPGTCTLECLDIEVLLVAATRSSCRARTTTRWRRPRTCSGLRRTPGTCWRAWSRPARASARSARCRGEALSSRRTAGRTTSTGRAPTARRSSGSTGSSTMSCGTRRQASASRSRSVAPSPVAGRGVSAKSTVLCTLSTPTISSSCKPATTTDPRAPELISVPPSPTRGHVCSCAQVAAVGVPRAELGEECALDARI